jgi:hypothetical protein
MEEKNKNISIFQFFRSFFPVQLLIGHLKYNLLALFYWLILFLIATDRLGSAFGIPLLFFSPEYLGEVSGLAFFFIGFSIGGFTMGFNTYSYIKIGPHYPFLLVVKKPFLKFCVNNSIIPIVFSILFMYNFSAFQLNEEFASTLDILIYNFSFIGGIVVFMLLSLLYFFPKKQEHLTDTQNGTEDHFSKQSHSYIHKKEKWFDFIQSKNEKAYIYIGTKLKLYNSRSVKHLDENLKEKVFNSNKVNTSLFELITIVAFISLGLFREYVIFEIPAAMSVVLLLTVVLMLFSAMLSWLHRWTYPIVFLVILSMDYLSTHSELFTYKNFAYGLSYDDEPKNEYSIKNIQHSNPEVDLESRKKYIRILEAWKNKTGEDKPKLIITNSSGGGSRSALWTFTVLQKTDELLNGDLNKHVQLMTGASGGMVGAAYFREILLRYKKGEFRSMYSGDFSDKISKDLLNKLCFSLSTNDLLFRYQSVNINGHSYTKDRGYAFEKQLHENTDNALNHTLGYYKSYEADGTIPVIILSPTIVNDGRRLLISSQSLSFLTSPNQSPSSMIKSYENIDYQNFFRSVKPNNIRFSTALRAQATFPFVLPMVTMPTNPGVQLMDAGIRDNYGSKSMMEFLNTMKDWIKMNTSGVIILQIRDTKKVLNKEVYRKVSMLDKVTLPFGNMYKNFSRTQDFDQDELLKVGVNGLNFPVDFVTFNLRENKTDRISLSWHLTKNEKQKIERAYRSKHNQTSLQQLKNLLK